jgi:hypothetical protein
MNLFSYPDGIRLNNSKSVRQLGFMLLQKLGYNPSFEFWTVSLQPDKYNSVMRLLKPKYLLTKIFILRNQYSFL